MIERASWSDGAMDDVIRQPCRYAPVEIRRHIDARREARGLPPLWSIPARLQAARKRALAAIKRNAAFLEQMQSR